MPPVLAWLSRALCLADTEQLLLLWKDVDLCSWAGLSGDEFKNGTDFVKRCDEPLITWCIFFPATARLQNSVDGIFDLRHTFDLPAPKNFRALKEAGAFALAIDPGFHIGCRRQSDFDWERLIKLFDGGERESVNPAIELNCGFVIKTDTLVGVVIRFLIDLGV